MTAAVTAAAPASGGGGGGDDCDGNTTLANANVTGEHGGSSGGGVAGWTSRKRWKSPCAGGSWDVMEVGMGMEVEGGHGGGGGEEGRREGDSGGRDITSFSPYAARLGSGTSPEDDVGR